MTSFPQTFRVRQKLVDQAVEDIGETLKQEFSKLNLPARIEPGESVAVTVGSRGIANIAEITRQIVLNIKSAGGEPFIVPAMGSHAGATAQGQRALIEAYGVTEEFCGCPIRSSMKTSIVCQAKEGFPVHFDEHALSADHVIVCNRIKPHTDFSGEIESGLMKMMLIGLGKHEGARIYHSAILDYSFDQIVRSVSQKVIERCNVLAGVAVVEDGLDQTSHLEVIGPADIEKREAELLKIAKQRMPMLPFDRMGVLLVDEVGKNISGTGLDTNVVGRKRNNHEALEHEFPKIRRIAVRSLTKETHGNATGIGVVEFCHRRVIDEMDYEATRINCTTSGRVAAGMLPFHYENDRELLSAALGSIGLVKPEDAKMIWIRNTLELLEVECSTAFYDDASRRPDLTIVLEPRPIEFDEDGNLVDRF